MDNLEKLLTVPYREENYKKFTTDFLKEVERIPVVKKSAIPSAFRNVIESYKVFGKYIDNENNKIIILSVKVKDGSIAIKAQRNFVSHLLENVFLDFSAALVAYFDDIRKNWKLSFVTVDYEIEGNNVQLKFKPAKRFSFLVGQDEPTKTYKQQLKPIYDSNNNPSLVEITEAFSVDKLSKYFYDDYKKKYFELYDYLIRNSEFKKQANNIGYIGEENEKKFVTTFCKKTLGQVVFLHFIQKKGWLGVTKEWGDGDKNYLINSTKNYKGNYFDDFLEPLFYKALNTKREDDMYLGKKVPFLNGGLFHPIENYNWKNDGFGIPNDYWYNSNETGLLNILSQYNFTVDESSPEEQEMAIDPEMLGKIFESLLDTNDRSSLGAFYTPREIVHFMCEESLATRISKMLSIDYDSILNFIRYGDALKETEFIKEFASDIDQCVTQMTIVDPAVGSGAFLVGMLNQIVKLRSSLSQFTNKEIDKYTMKLETINNSLYGVDLEYDAVEIAKLRLWLSLVVDQEAKIEKPRPLPNLNFHLKVGNSLVDSFDGIKLWENKKRGLKKEAKIDYEERSLFNYDEIDDIKDKINDAKTLFFSTSNEETKQQLSKEIDGYQMELIKTSLISKEKKDLYLKIEQMIEKKTKPFFLWELEFDEVYRKGDGFDIVIANPPYVQLQKDGGKLADELKDQGYDTYTRSGDIYCIFYEKGLSLLKNEGVLCYITSNKWMRAGYGEKLRGYLAKNSNPLKLIDLGGNKVFESATVDVNILLATREENKGETKAVTVEKNFSNNLSDYFKQYSYSLAFDNSDNWVILNSIEASIKRKIEAIGVPLEKWDIHINYGIKTGYNDAFIVDEVTKKALIDADQKSAELIRPILRGRDIGRYSYNFQNLWLICIPCGFTKQHTKQDYESWFKDNYSSIYNYLITTEAELSRNRSKKSKGLYKRDDQGDFWWELRSCEYMDDFNKQKIMYNDINKRLSFCLVNDHIYCNNTVYFFTIDKHSKYLLSILNSKLINWYYKYISVQLGNKTTRMFSIYVKKIPIPAPELSVESLLDTLVEDFPSFSNKDNEIDKVVYSIYDLSETEIEYIENCNF